MRENRTEKMDFRCTKKEKEKIEELAKYLEMPTGALLRNLTLASYDDAVIFKKIGLLKGAKKYKDFKEKYHTFFSPTLPGFD